MIIDQKDVERVAKGLLAANNYGADRAYSVAPGFSVPMWLTYISEAEKIVRRDAALKHK